MNSIFHVVVKVWCDGDCRNSAVIIAKDKQSAISQLSDYGWGNGLLENGAWKIIGSTDMDEQVLARETC